MPPEGDSPTPSESSASQSAQAQGLGRQLIDLQRENSRLQQSLDYANQSLDSTKDKVHELQTNFSSLQNQYASKTTEVNALQGLYQAGVLPEYQDLMAREAATALSQVGDKPVAEVMDGLRQKYPAMFKAEGNPVGAGATPSATPPSPPTSSTVSAGDNQAFLANLEGIANGSIEAKY